MEEQEGLTWYEMTSLSGITYRQLDYWDRTGYLSPSVQPADGFGSSRLYSQADLEKAKLTKDLLDLGVSLERIRKDGDPKVTMANLRKAMKGERT